MAYAVGSASDRDELIELVAKHPNVQTNPEPVIYYSTAGSP